MPFDEFDVLVAAFAVALIVALTLDVRDMLAVRRWWSGDHEPLTPGETPAPVEVEIVARFAELRGRRTLALERKARDLGYTVTRTDHGFGFRQI